jgi:hypothetical protein
MMCECEDEVLCDGCLDRMREHYANEYYRGALHALPGGDPKDPMCYNPDCEKMHNETGHHYGCSCDDCMREYWLLKH